MAETKKVRLFYLGGIKTTRNNQKVASGREIISLPPKGEFLDVPEHVAIDLERKHKYILPNGDVLAVFTRDARVAKRVRDGMNLEQAYAPQVGVADFSSDDLLNELRKRGELNDAVVSEVKPKAAPKSKTPAKPKAKTEPDSKKQDTVNIDPLSTGV